MLAKASEQLLRLNVKGLTDPKQREHRERPTGLDHLPMPNAEAVRIHVLLAQFSFGSQTADSMAEGTKESCIIPR
jgi:hypothetical protein